MEETPLFGRYDWNSTTSIPFNAIEPEPARLSPNVTMKPITLFSTLLLGFGGNVLALPQVRFQVPF